MGDSNTGDQARLEQAPAKNAPPEKAAAVRQSHPKAYELVHQTWSSSLHIPKRAPREPDGASHETTPSGSSPARHLFDKEPAIEPKRAPGRSTEFPVASWDRYEFLRLLGVGGMARVYMARDRQLGRIVALKFCSENGVHAKLRFMQEARAQARIDHQEICKIFEVGEVESKAYIAMEFIDGHPLDKAKQELSLWDKVRLIKETAGALHFAHELGIVHRDIKPSNIMVEVRPEGGFRPVLMDFGIARDASQMTRITETGAVIGTFAYMSPEQANGESRRLDRRSDIYSIGATLFELLAGRPPFHSATLAETVLNGLIREAPSLKSIAPTVPKELDVIVSKCLNKEPAQRYATAQDLADDLGRFLNHERIVAKKVSLLYRLRWRARQNKALTAVAAALLTSLMVLAGYSIRTRVESLLKDQQARQQAALAHRLGQSVEELEWLTRVAYMMPLHDTRADLHLVRQRMLEIESQMRSYGEVGKSLGYYALGRGYLALHEWKPAYEHLRKAEAAGFHGLELDYALGQVLGALYTTELVAASRSGDKSFFRKRRTELEQELLVPARAYLEKGRGLKTASTSYVDGLIDYYHERFEPALRHAQTAQQQISWQYEAIKLEGDVHMARALERRDRGEYELAEKAFREALGRYAAASDIGRSDHQLYEASAEAWVRLMEMADLRGQSPQQYLDPALAAAKRSLVAAPDASDGHTKEAFAYLFVTQAMESQLMEPAFLAMTNRLITAGEAAVRLHPDDVYARDALGNGYINIAKYKLEHREPYLDFIKMAKEQFSAAISTQVRFPWAYNDLGRAYFVEGDDRLLRREDPTQPYQAAIKAFTEAVALDGEYQFGYTNLAMTYASLARHAIEHGADPSPYLEKLTASARRTLSLNGKSIDAHLAFVLGYTLRSLYDLESSGDVEKSAAMAQSYIDKLVKLQQDLPMAYERLGFTYYVLARQHLNQATDPTEALQKGLEALGTCDKLRRGQDGLCSSLTAKLLSLQAQQLRQQGKAVSKLLERSLAMAQQAASVAPTDTDALLLAAEASWQAAAVGQSLGRSMAPQLQAGLAAVEQTLAIAPSWPRALAIKGALYVSQARSSTSESARQAALGQARPLLSQALAGNPLLRNAYPAAFAELVAKGAPQAASRPQ